MGKNAKLKISAATITKLFDKDAETIMIGEDVVTIRPLSVDDIQAVLGRVRILCEGASAFGVDFNQVIAGDPAAVTTMFQYIVKEAPDLASDLTGVEQESIRELPIGIAIDLLGKAVEVNLKRMEEIKKSFESLSVSINKFVGDAKKASRRGEGEVRDGKEIEGLHPESVSTDPADPVNMNEFPKGKKRAMN